MAEFSLISYPQPMPFTAIEKHHAAGPFSFAPNLGRLHAVSLHERQLRFAGGGRCMRPELLKFFEVSVQRRRMQDQKPRDSFPAVAECVRNASRNQNEGARATDMSAASHRKFHAPIKNIVGFLAMSVPVRRWLTPTRRQRALHQRKRSTGCGCDSFEKHLTASGSEKFSFTRFINNRVLRHKRLL